METGYDVCIDVEVLDNLESKLKQIGYNLHNATGQMMRSIQNSERFLSGSQFEKAKLVTQKCTYRTQVTENNLISAIKYLESLRAILVEYGKCVYSEGTIK